MEITDDLLAVMGGDIKRFFHAEYDAENNKTMLGEVAPWQEW